MKQVPSPHHSRTSVPSSRSLWRPIGPHRFTLQVRLRGQLGPACEVHCTGLEQAIHWGAAEFPAFAERNPWIGLDSLQRKIWILLDPETASTT
jgi:hypothetical protein